VAAVDMVVVDTAAAEIAAAVAGMVAAAVDMATSAAAVEMAAAVAADANRLKTEDFGSQDCLR
jgi:hypothetical protein